MTRVLKNSLTFYKAPEPIPEAYVAEKWWKYHFRIALDTLSAPNFSLQVLKF
jgi:hypothetical protein